MGVDSFLSFVGDKKPLATKEPKKKKTTKSKIRPYDKSFLKTYFSEKKKVSKDDYVVFKGLMTILGTDIRPTDKIIQVLMINAEGVESNTFASVTIRYVVERELRDTSCVYVSLDDSRREPVLVERKYMEDLEYDSARQKIVEQFL